MPHDILQPEYLFRLARSGSPDDRQNLAQAVIGFMHSELSAGERTIAEEILLQLLKDAEVDMRMALADQLAGDPQCPEALINYLVYENPFEVAESMLQYSQALTEEYLIDVIQHFDDTQYWQCIARRRQIGEGLTRYLIGTQDRDVYRILVKNRGADFCPISIEWMVQSAIQFPELQGPLIARSEVTPELAAKLYWHVSAELRVQITSRFDVDIKQIDALLNKMVKHRLATRQDQVEIVVTPDLMAQAEAIREHRGITSHELLEALQKEKVGLFCCLWATLLHVDPAMIVRKMQEDATRNLAVLCCAARITIRHYNVFFLLWRRADRNTRSGMDLATALDFYKSMDLNTARDTLAQWQQDAAPTLMAEAEAQTFH